MTDAPMHNKVECWIAYTNPETHRIILDNIQRSPLYGGMIEGVGPRYCPSIEDKVVRFAGKDRHPHLRGALRREHRGNVSAGCVQQSAGGCAECILPEHQGLRKY